MQARWIVVRQYREGYLLYGDGYSPYCVHTSGPWIVEQVPYLTKYTTVYLTGALEPDAAVS